MRNSQTGTGVQVLGAISNIYKNLLNFSQILINSPITVTDCKLILLKNRIPDI